MCWRTREHADKHSQDCMGVTLGSGSTGCVTSRARPSSLHAARANGQQPSAATISLPRMGADHLLTDLLGRTRLTNLFEGGASLGSLRRVLRRADRRN